MSTPHHDAALILDDYQRRAEYLPDTSPGDSGARAALVALLDDLAVMIALAIVSRTRGGPPITYPSLGMIEHMAGAECNEIRLAITAELAHAVAEIRAKDESLRTEREPITSW